MIAPSHAHAPPRSHGLLAGAVGAARHGVDWVAHHTGLPVLLVLAVLIVVSWRIFKRTVGLVIEVAIVVVSS
jgi:hypothetical protein